MGKRSSHHAAVPAPTPDRRHRSDGEDRRRAILRATEDLLNERALAEISVADISARAGVVRSGFYFYFPTKGAAVTAALADVAEEMLDGAVAFFSDDQDGVEGVRASIWAVWRSWSAHQSLILGMLDARGNDPAVREIWYAWIDRFVAALGDAVASKRAAGLAPPGVDPHQLVVVLLPTIEHTLERMSRAGTRTKEAAEMVETLVMVWSLAIYGRYQPVDPSVPSLAKRQKTTRSREIAE